MMPPNGQGKPFSGDSLNERRRDDEDSSSSRNNDRSLLPQNLSLAQIFMLDFQRPRNLNDVEHALDCPFPSCSMCRYRLCNTDIRLGPNQSMANRRLILEAIIQEALDCLNDAE